MAKRSSQQGFTLIELIVVIIILGILGAVALPRFVDLQIQARQAKLQGAVGSVRAAAALFHAQCQAGLSATPPLANCASISMEGVAVTGVNNYPTADAAGIVIASGLNTATTASAGIDYLRDAGGAGAGSTLTISVPTPTTGSCQFTYAAPAAAGAAPIVTITNTACN